MIDQWTHDEGCAENAEIEQKEKIPLLCEIDLQPLPHGWQTEDGPKHGEDDSKHKHAGARTEEQGSGAMVVAHGYRFSDASYASYTRLLLSAGIPETLGDTNTGGL